MREKPPTETMLSALQYMTSHENKIIRRSGGFWVAEGRKLSLYPSYGTSTIDALVKRGYAEYTKWQDGKRGKFPIECTLTQLGIETAGVEK